MTQYEDSWWRLSNSWNSVFVCLKRETVETKHSRGIFDIYSQISLKTTVNQLISKLMGKGRKIKGIYGQYLKAEVTVPQLSLSI